MCNGFIRFLIREDKFSLCSLDLKLLTNDEIDNLVRNSVGTKPLEAADVSSKVDFER